MHATHSKLILLEQMRSTRDKELGYIWYENNKRIMEDTVYQEQKLGSSNWGMKIKSVSSSYKPKTKILLFHMSSSSACQCLFVLGNFSCQLVTKESLCDLGGGGGGGPKTPQFGKKKYKNTQ